MSSHKETLPFHEEHRIVRDYPPADYAKVFVHDLIDEPKIIRGEE